MTQNEKLYDKALGAIKALYNDQSVSRDDARVNLETLKDEINLLLDALEND